MSKHVRLLASAALIAGVLAAPVSAWAQHHGGYHGYHGYHGGWGWGPHAYFGFGYPGYYSGRPYYYGDPYYYYDPPPPPECD